MTPKQLANRAHVALAPLDRYSHQCHAASIALVKSGVLGPCRVARGTCRGVMGQHSWVVLGNDCYADRATIVDPTLWSYDEKVKGVWVGKPNVHEHRPHGAGSIWEWGKPQSFGGTPEPISPDVKLSPDAKLFLSMIGPLDRRGWMSLASHAPVEGWPAGEIFAAMDDTPALSAFVPVDKLGMLTDRNPMGLYLSDPSVTVQA